MGHSVRLLSASVDIAAPPATVWRIVTNVRRTGEWSPECRKVLAPKTIGAGSRFVGINQRRLMLWPTNAKVVRFTPERELAYRIAENGSTWSYSLEPIDHGTRLTEAREAADGITGFAHVFTKLFLGGEAHTSELDDGIRASLDRIKVIAERERP